MLVIACRGASSIRVSQEKANDYYLMPLPATIVSTEILLAILTPVDSPSPIIEPIDLLNDKGEVFKIAKGFERNEIVTTEVDGETISCLVLCTVIHSIKPATAQEKALDKRLQKAKTAIAELTRPLSLYKCITTLVSIWLAVDGILKQ